jgi:uncharacterized membrane protein
MRNYFDRLFERFPPLAWIIEKELFEVLENVSGLLAIAMSHIVVADPVADQTQ